VDLLALLRSGEAYQRAAQDAWPPLDAMYEIQVAWWPESLWLVEDERDAARLVAEGVARARIWTVAELRSLLDTNASPGASGDLVRAVALARLEFDGDVQTVRRTTSAQRPAPIGPAPQARDTEPLL
jgi:hypothetical protein